jgi:hypothetical protein
MIGIYIASFRNVFAEGGIMNEKKDSKNRETNTANRKVTIAPPEPQAPLPQTIEDAPKPREEQAP